VMRRESFRLLIADVQQLPETQRTALLLREIDALSYEQIAHAMETTVPSVKSLLVRARISLAEAAEARKLSCEEVRLELGEVAEGLSKLGAPARRHVRDCERCHDFKKHLKANNHALAAIFPVGPLLMLKKLILTKLGSTASAGGAHVAGGAGATAGAGATVAAGAAGAGGTSVGGGLLTAGAGALASKAVAGLAAAALVTAGAVAAEHNGHVARHHHTASANTAGVSQPNAPAVPVVVHTQAQPISAATTVASVTAVSHRGRRHAIVDKAAKTALAPPATVTQSSTHPVPVAAVAPPVKPVPPPVTQVTTETTELPAAATEQPQPSTPAAPVTTPAPSEEATSPAPPATIEEPAAETTPPPATDTEEAPPVTQSDPATPSDPIEQTGGTPAPSVTSAG
jgi:hypothetical protein